MWCGIVAIILAGFNVIQNYGLLCPYGFSVWVFIVAMITGGLICTLKDNRRIETEEETEKEKEKNTIQDIRGNILKRKQFKLKRDSQNKDK